MRRIYPDDEYRAFDSALLKSFKVMIMKDISLALQPLYGDICPDVAVRIKTFHICRSFHSTQVTGFPVLGSGSLRGSPSAA